MKGLKCCALRACVAHRGELGESVDRARVFMNFSSFERENWHFTAPS